ncbi:hypothetical protein [Aneurinibacillus terranovensis]|uniref:hypothetical protein n=1 Tax=Aneurinibacillus terranovensis TaxID=278991 RepID=UPI00040C5618|nr:hypothetical protein [Aneurinibacillus terranovensis]
MKENRIDWDETNLQILSSMCRKCPEPHFQPRTPELPQIGCCAYEPVFTLFEIYKMVSSGEEEFFLHSIYPNPKNTVYDYEIIAGGNIHPLFYKKQPGQTETPYERHESLKKSVSTAYLAVDERLGYTMCQFFEEENGCGLPPAFKTSICRSFMCCSIEKALTEEERVLLDDWRRRIREEAETFHRKHKEVLQGKGISLGGNVLDIIGYLKQVDG